MGPVQRQPRLHGSGLLQHYWAYQDFRGHRLTRGNDGDDDEDDVDEDEREVNLGVNIFTTRPVWDEGVDERTDLLRVCLKLTDAGCNLRETVRDPPVPPGEFALLRRGQRRMAE